MSACIYIYIFACVSFYLFRRTGGTVDGHIYYHASSVGEVFKTFIIYKWKCDLELIWKQKEFGMPEDSLWKYIV